MGTNKTPRISISVSHASANHLEHVSNKSGYIDSLVAEAAQRGAEAIVVAQAAGWTTKHVEAACEALSGGCQPHQVSDELTLWARLTDRRAPNGWGAFAEEMTHHHRAQALLVLVREMGRGNRKLQMQVEGLA